MNGAVSLKYLTGRNIRLYFKDKITFFTSLITPLLLLVLFSTFLKNIYRDTFLQMIPTSIKLDENIADAFAAGWMMSSILSVTCVTVSFCSNLIAANDKISGAITDLSVSPVRSEIIYASYFLANLFTTLIICLSTMLIGFIYIATQGWYYTAGETFVILLNVLLMVTFGSTLAAAFEFNIKTTGGISAVTALVSALYGFICGAYMPMSQFSKVIKDTLTFLPSSYGTVLLRNNYVRPVTDELSGIVPGELISAIHDAVDVNIYFFDHRVEVWKMYIIVAVTALAAFSVYLIMTMFAKRKKS